MSQKNGLCFRMKNKEAIYIILLVLLVIVLIPNATADAGDEYVCCVWVTLIPPARYVNTALLGECEADPPGLFTFEYQRTGYVSVDIEGNSDQALLIVEHAKDVGCINPPRCPYNISESPAPYCVCNVNGQEKVYLKSDGDDGGTCGSETPLCTKSKLQIQECGDWLMHSYEDETQSLKDKGGKFFTGPLYTPQDRHLTGPIKGHYVWAYLPQDRSNLHLKGSADYEIYFQLYKVPEDYKFKEHVFMMDETPVEFNENWEGNHNWDFALPDLQKGWYLFHFRLSEWDTLFSGTDVELLRARLTEGSANKNLKEVFSIMNSFGPVPFDGDISEEECGKKGGDWNENAPIDHQCCGDDGYDDYYVVDGSGIENKYLCHKHKGQNPPFKWKWWSASDWETFRIREMNKILNLKQELLFLPLLPLPELGVGDNSEGVNDLEIFLVNQGYTISQVDNLFEEETETEVINYKTDEWLFDSYPNYPDNTQGPVDYGEANREVLSEIKKDVDNYYDVVSSGISWYACEPGNLAPANLWFDTTTPLYGTLATGTPGESGGTGNIIITASNELTAAGQIILEKNAFDFGALWGASYICGADCKRVSNPNCLTNINNCLQDPHCKWGWDPGENDPPVNPPPDKHCTKKIEQPISGLSDLLNRDSFICYDKEGSRLYAECCGKPGTNCMNRDEGFLMGAPLHSVINFDLTHTEGDNEYNKPKDYILIDQFESDLGATDRLLLPTDVRVALLNSPTVMEELGVPHNNYFDIKIEDWTPYNSLEFDIAYTVVNDMEIKFKNTHEPYTTSPRTGGLSLAQYSYNGGGPLKWHHISIPITDIDALFGSQHPDQITEIVFETQNPGVRFAMVIDNIYLKRAGNPNANSFCSGKRTWIIELDEDEGACRAQLPYAWTGGEGQKGCCGDDKNIHAEPPTTEYFNVLVSDGGTGVACWDGSGIFNNKRVSEVFVGEYPYIINFNGQFYNCNGETIPLIGGFDISDKNTCENPYNLIKNPGFEDGGSFWNDATIVNYPYFKGGHSLKLSTTPTTQSFFAPEGEYSIKLWVNKIGTADLNLKINGFQHTMIYKTTVNNWELYTNYGEFNPDSSGDFDLELSNPGSGGLFVDEVVVMQDLGKVYHCSVDNEWDELSYVDENGMPTNEPGEIGEISDLRDSKKFTPEPITSGCCPDNYCFKKEGSDDKCVKQYPDGPYENIFYEPIDPNNPPLSVYACIDGSWATREKRLSYHTPPFWGYCPGANQCYKGTAGNNNPDECVDEGTIQYDEDTYIYYYCSQGTWTQTELIIHPPPDGEYYSCNLAPTDPLLDLTDPDTGELYLGQYGERNLGHCETPNNLIKNNGFELETNLWSTSGTTFTNRIYGQKSLRLTNSQSAEQQFTTLNAETHQFKVWYKGDKNNIDVQIFGEYEISQEISNANKEASNDLGEWKLYTGEVELSSQTNYKIKILSTGGTIYIDDVAVYYDILNSDGSFEYVCDVDNSWQLPNILGSGGSFLIDNLKDTLKLGIGLVGNGGFENGQHAYFYSESESHGEYSIITGNAHSGPFSLKLHSTGTSPVHTNQVEYQIDIPGSLFIPGETYTYSLWAKLGLGSGTDTRVTHGRLHYSDCANVFWNGQGPTSTSWQRLSHTFTVDPNCDLYLLALYIGYAGETDGWVGNRYVDDIQIERNSEPTPYKQSGNGCCPASYCWDGTECKENRAVSNNYLCLNGAWDFAVVKWNPSHTYSTTRCAATECYYGNTNDGTQCTEANTYIQNLFGYEDAYCEGIYDDNNNLVGAEWTSRTKKIALQFLKFIQDNPQIEEYTLFCDEKKNALNYDYIYVNVNNFCVLKYGNNENNVALGTTFDTDALPSFLANLGIGQNYCDGVLNQLDGQFHKCSGDKRVWYNPSLNAIIYAKNQITLNYIVDWWQAFVNWLRNLFLGIIDTGQTIDFVNQQPFNRLYIYQDNEGKTIRGITGKVNADKFVYVEYLGFIDVCEKINAIYPATTLCVDNVVDIDQTTYNNINNNLPGEEDVWKDLTSKLRIDPDTYTLSSTTTTTMPDSCTDSDGGNEPYTVGITSGYFGGSSYSYTDYCINSVKLTEYYCSGTTSTSTIHTCPYYGMECINGQCVYPGTTTLPT